MKSTLESEIMKKQFTPLNQETRSILKTEEAAFHLNRAPQTLRIWACKRNGPIQPIHVGQHLAWKVSDIKALLGS